MMIYLYKKNQIQDTFTLISFSTFPLLRKKSQTDSLVAFSSWPKRTYEPLQAPEDNPCCRVHQGERAAVACTSWLQLGGGGVIPQAASRWTRAHTVLFARSHLPPRLCVSMIYRFLQPRRPPYLQLGPVLRYTLRVCVCKIARLPYGLVSHVRAGLQVVARPEQTRETSARELRVVFRTIFTGSPEMDR